MKPLSAFFKEMFKKDELLLTMSQLSKIAEVSPSQLRYWERKGYIQSEQGMKNQNHLFSMHTLFQVMLINYFLKQGYTLAVAVEKEKDRREILKIYRQYIFNQNVDIRKDKDGKAEIVLGKVQGSDTEVYATINNGEVNLHLRNKSKS
ncbi:MerR family transcriptional regulator [Lactobacillaceae bacterium 24-114]